MYAFVCAKYRVKKPDTVEYVPAMQRLQTREPAGKVSSMQNQSTADIGILHAAV
jgi:hypothetical protein